jgi:hypothetical protein
VRGSNGALYTKVGDASGGIDSIQWGNWGSYGGQLLEGTGPAMVSRNSLNDYSPVYFVTGTNHQLYSLGMCVNCPWNSLGGYLTSGPAAASYANTVDVFVVGGDGGIWSKNTTNMGTNWNQWYEVPW